MSSQSKTGSIYDRPIANDLLAGAAIFFVLAAVAWAFNWGPFHDAPKEELADRSFVLVSTMTDLASELSELAGDIDDLYDPVEVDHAVALYHETLDLREEVMDQRENLSDLWSQIAQARLDIGYGDKSHGQAELDDAIERAPALLEPLSGVFSWADNVIARAQSAGVEIDPRLPERLARAQKLSAEVVDQLDD